MITLCILSWKRPENVLKIINREFDGEVISEVLIWNNNPDIDLFRDFDLPEGVRLIQTSEDYGVRTRFANALFAKNECILYHDDDVHLPPVTIKALYDEWRLDEDIIVGVAGGNSIQGECKRCLKAGNDKDHFKHYYDSVREGEAEIILGHGVMLHRKNCANFYLHHYDLPAPEGASPFDSHDDIVLSYIVMHINQRPNYIINARIEWLEDGGVAISGREPHYPQRAEMVRLCKDHFDLHSYTC